MLFITRNSLLGLACLLSSVAPANAQELTWAQKMFNSQKIDFGVIARGSDASFRVKITNLYKEQVHISNVRTTCGCSAATPSQNTFASRESAYIEVTMDTRRFTRRKDSNLIVTFDQPIYAEVTIPITAYIRTDVVLEPGSANFGAIDQGTGAEKKITVAYAGRDNWKIKEVRTKNKHLSAKVVETEREAGRVNYNLVVNLDSETPVGLFRDQLFLITDDQNSPQVPVLVEARVEADITITPNVISLGKLTPGQTKTANIVLRGKKPFEIKSIQCESEEKMFQARLPKNAKVVHVVPLTITCPDKPGSFSEVFSVTIIGRNEPISFKAYGTVAGETASSTGLK